MDIRKKIGQLFILGFYGDIVSNNHPIVRDIKEHNLGGVILFDKLLAHKKKTNNIVSKKQVKTLTDDLKSFASTKLFVCMDQEGGMVSRLPEEMGFINTASPKEIGIKDDLSFTRSQAEQVAHNLKYIGVNLNFAPVVDLDINPHNPIISRYERSFSKEAKKVIDHASCWIETCNRENIISCLKHFPGHGSADADSHLGFVDVSKSWSESELIPYKKIIDKNLVQVIMTAHLFNEHLDPKYPATLSRNTITKLLREDLGYAGVVVSDDMQMAAITRQYSISEGVIHALAAGVDMFIIGNNIDHDENILATMVDCVIDGINRKIISEELVNSAYNRIQKLKSIIS